MARKLYKFLSDWGNSKKDDVLEFEETEVKALVDNGTLADAGAGVENALVAKAVGQLTDGITKAVESATKAAIEAATKAVTVRVEPVPGGSEADKQKSFGDYLITVRKANAPMHDIQTGAVEKLDKVYGVSKRLDETTGSAGAFLVPVTYSTEIFKIEDEGAVFAQHCTPKMMVTPEHTCPALAQTSAPPNAKSSAYHAGVKLFYKSEKAARTQSEPAFDQITMKANDLTGLTEVSRNAANDAKALESEVKDAFGRAISWRKDLEYLFGGGNGSPLGALNANNPSLVTVTRTTSSDFKYLDVLNMLAALPSGSMTKSYWYASQTLIPKLGTLKDDAGNSVLVANNTGGARDKFPMTLFNLPITFSEKFSALGTLGDIALIDPRYYWDGMLGGLEIGMSEHFKWDEDAISFRFKLRHDGQPALKGKIKLAERKTTGNTVVSPFVILAA